MTIVDNKSPNLDGFEIARLSRCAQEQITDYLRKEICEGGLKPGMKLPSTQELAARWQAHANTIQRAMVPLVKEGLLGRKPRVGTFVLKRKKKLTCVGVYCGSSVSISPFSYAVRQALREELYREGIEMTVWGDPRPANQHHQPWKPMVKAAENREFQAFIATEIDLNLLRWQEKLPVPTAFLGAPMVSSNVGHDMRQFIEVGLRELARQGCRSVGMIAPILNDSNAGHPEPRHLVSLGMLECFMEVAGELGLTVKNDWMRIFLDHPGGQRGAERFGYEEFLKLWGQRQRPDGLLVHTEDTARGMLQAIQKKQVRVPGELKLALCKNETIGLFCPMPATFVVASEREAARALIRQVQKQFRGESCEPIFLPFKIVAHNPP